MKTSSSSNDIMKRKKKNNGKESLTKSIKISSLKPVEIYPFKNFESGYFPRINQKNKPADEQLKRNASSPTISYSKNKLFLSSSSVASTFSSKKVSKINMTDSIDIDCATLSKSMVSLDSNKSQGFFDSIFDNESLFEHEAPTEKFDISISKNDDSLISNENKNQINETFGSNMRSDVNSPQTNVINESLSRPSSPPMRLFEFGLLASSTDSEDKKKVNSFDGYEDIEKLTQSVVESISKPALLPPLKSLASKTSADLSNLNLYSSQWSSSRAKSAGFKGKLLTKRLTEGPRILRLEENQVPILNYEIVSNKEKNVETSNLSSDELTNASFDQNGESTESIASFNSKTVLSLRLKSPPKIQPSENDSQRESLTSTKDDCSYIKEGISSLKKLDKLVITGQHKSIQPESGTDKLESNSMTIDLSQSISSEEPLKIVDKEASPEKIKRDSPEDLSDFFDAVDPVKAIQNQNSDQLNEQAIAINTEDTMPYQVHKRILGWKLTSIDRRKELLKIMDFGKNNSVSVTAEQLYSGIIDPEISNQIKNSSPSNTRFSISKREADSLERTVARMLKSNKSFKNKYTIKSLMEEKKSNRATSSQLKLRQMPQIDEEEIDSVVSNFFNPSFSRLPSRNQHSRGSTPGVRALYNYPIDINRVRDRLDILESVKMRSQIESKLQKENEDKMVEEFVQGQHYRFHYGHNKSEENSHSNSSMLSGFEIRNQDDISSLGEMSSLVDEDIEEEEESHLKEFGAART